jgi:hypothetical protein
VHKTTLTELNKYDEQQKAIQHLSINRKKEEEK